MSSDNNLYTKTLEEIIAFGHEKIEGKTVVEWLTLEETILWFYIRFMLFNSVRSAAINQPKTSKKKASTLGLKLKFVFMFFGRAIRGAFSGQPKNKHWLMVNPNVVLPILGVNAEGKITGDGYMEYLTQKAICDNRFLLVSEFYPPKFELGVTHLNTRNFSAKHHLYLEWYLLRALLNPINWLKIKKFSKTLAYAIATIESNSNAVFAKKLRQYKRLMLFSKFREMAFEVAVKSKQPLSISGTNEHDTKLKSLIEPAKRMGIKTFGIQHGIIHKQHIHYVYSEDDMKYQPIPHKTLTWGNQAKAVLHNFSSYPDNSVVTVGQIRTDVIPALLKRNQEKGYIFFAGQMYHAVDYGYRSLISKDILAFSAAHPEEKIVIKPHPRQADVVGFWKSLEEEGKSYNYEIVFDDLYEVTSGAKMVITHNSTAGGEAIYFNKPLILTDYSKDDLANFIAEGIGKPVYNFSELEEAITSVNDWNSTLENNREKFIADRAYKIDGKVCDRIIEEITF